LDQSYVPDGDSPSVSAPFGERDPALLGWSRSIATPKFRDRRRRLPPTERPADFGHTLHPGEEFRFNVTFAGNPVGLAEARVISRKADPRGPPPRGAPTVQIEGHARTSGILSLVSTITDDAVSRVDASSGAPIWSENVIRYEGWTPRKYRLRVTRTAHEGRGQVRIVDAKDKKSRKLQRRVPRDTFDPMSSMAWVRSLRLEPGELAKAHAMDGTALLRVEIVGRGKGAPDPMPSIVTALGLKKGDIDMIEGTITRVDRYDRAIPEKRVYKLRAWLSADERRIPLALESDMWVGAIRLDLAQYQPPH